MAVGLKQQNLNRIILGYGYHNDKNFSVHLVSSYVVWIGNVAEEWGTFLPDTILAFFLWNYVNM